jgi:hypothetical protein
MTPTISASNWHDDRPLVADLLDKHSEAIASVQKGVYANDIGKELYTKGGSAQCYDDIWILRFVLSHRGNVKSATKAAIKTMIFREEKKLNVVGDLRHKLKHFNGEDNDVTSSDVTSTDLPGRKLFNSFCEKDAILHFLPDKNKSIWRIVQLCKINLDKLVTEMSEEDLLEWYLYENEAVYQVVDEITRRTGRLTKSMKIIDMTNMQLLKMNRTFVKRDAAASKRSEDFYPQLLGTMFIFNSPGWLSGFWTLVRPFFPKRVAEKIVFLPSLSKMKKPKKDFESISRHIPEAHLPEKYGGMNKTWPLLHAGSHFLQD